MGKLVFVGRTLANGGDYKQYRHPTYGLIGVTSFDLEPNMLWLEFLDIMAAKRTYTCPAEPNKPVLKPQRRA